MNECEECGNHLPSIQLTLCDECYNENLNEEEDDNGKTNNRTKEYNIPNMAISKIDLEALGDTSENDFIKSLTDKDMNYIAEKIPNSEFMENFWNAVREAFERLKEEKGDKDEI